MERVSRTGRAPRERRPGLAPCSAKVATTAIFLSPLSPSPLWALFLPPASPSSHKHSVTFSFPLPLLGPLSSFMTHTDVNLCAREAHGICLSVSGLFFLAWSRVVPSERGGAGCQLCAHLGPRGSSPGVTSGRPLPVGPATEPGGLGREPGWV